MKPLALVMREARALVAGGWSATFSRDTSGHVCEPRAEMVVDYSLHDAIDLACDGDVDARIDAEALLSVLAEPGHGRTLYDWEMDTSRTLRDVLWLLDRASARAAATARGGGA